MKATQLIHDDHETVDRLIGQLKSGETGSRTRDEMTTDLIRELSVHAAIEEQLLYPVVRELPAGLNGAVLEDLEEHHVIKVLASELEKLSADDERYQAKLAVLAENVTHHVEEEESEIFPALEQHLEDDELEELGADLERAKALAPTRPHPNAPDEPPANLVNLAAGVIDRIRDRVGA